MSIGKIVMVITVLAIVLGLGMSAKGNVDRHDGYAPSSEFERQNLIQAAPLAVISLQRE